MGLSSFKLKWFVILTSLFFKGTLILFISNSRMGHYQKNLIWKWLPMERSKLNFETNCYNFSNNEANLKSNSTLWPADVKSHTFFCVMTPPNTRFLSRIWFIFWKKLCVKLEQMMQTNRAETVFTPLCSSQIYEKDNKKNRSWRGVFRC